MNPRNPRVGQISAVRSGDQKQGAGSAIKTNKAPGKKNLEEPRSATSELGRSPRAHRLRRASGLELLDHHPMEG